VAALAIALALHCRTCPRSCPPLPRRPSVRWSSTKKGAVRRRVSEEEDGGDEEGGGESTWAVKVVSPLNLCSPPNTMR
jgi:hypothetical protein